MLVQRSVAGSFCPVWRSSSHCRSECDELVLPRTSSRLTYGSPRPRRALLQDKCYRYSFMRTMVLFSKKVSAADRGNRSAFHVRRRPRRALLLRARARASRVTLRCACESTAMATRGAAAVAVVLASLGGTSGACDISGHWTYTPECGTEYNW
jgi:hypothetical protein